MILTGLLTGFLVSLIEAVCTGQVYLPVLALLVKKNPGQWLLWFNLAVYNLIFILPLMIILSVAVFGISSQRLQEFLTKNVPLIKLLTALMFLGLFYALWFHF
jgi:hypothetical protein